MIFFCNYLVVLIENSTFGAFIVYLVAGDMHS